MMRGLGSRSTGDVLVLMIAGTVCFAVLAGGACIAVLAFVRPEVDVSKGVNSIRDIIGTLLGLVSGFLAGRNQWTPGEKHLFRPNGDHRLDAEE